jgi:hypothetical protein
VLILTFERQGNQQKWVAEDIKALQCPLAPYDSATLLLLGILLQGTVFQQALHGKRHLAILPVTWDDSSFMAVTRVHTQAVSRCCHYPGRYPGAAALCVTSVRARHDIRPNEQQRRTTEHTTHPNLITGPAGCSKSVVIEAPDDQAIESFSFVANKGEWC